MAQNKNYAVLIILLFIQFLIFEITVKKDLFETAGHETNSLGSSTSDGIGNKVWEVAFQDTDALPLQVWKYRGGQVAGWTLINKSQIGWTQGGVGVPSVNSVFTFVSEEEGRSKIGTQDYHFLGLDSQVSDFTSGASGSEVIGTNGENAASGQVGENEEVVAASLGDESDVEDVATASCNGLWKNDTVTFVACDVEDEDGTGGGVADVREWSTVWCVFDGDVLESRSWNDQARQVQGFDFLSGLQVDGDHFGWTVSDGSTQGVNDTDVQYPQDLIWIDDQINYGLQCLAGSFFLGRPTRERSQNSFATSSLQANFRQRYRHARFVSGKSQDDIVAVDLAPGCNDILGDITARGFVDSFSCNRRPLEHSSSPLN